MVKPPTVPQLPQNVAVVFRIGVGNFVDGFSITLQILENGQLIHEHRDLPDLPAAADLPRLYRDWHGISLENSRKIQAISAQVTNVADLEDWRQRTESLEDYCRGWFRQQSFRSLSYLIQANTDRNDQSIPIIVDCHTGNPSQDQVLRRLPWHLWDLFSSRHNTEFALLTKFHHRVSALTTPIRVLAIFGSAKGGLQLEQDEAALEILQRRGAQITKRSEPSQEELTHLLFDQAWDMLFFAGHSSSEGLSGRIQISENIDLPLHALRQSLTRAVAQGLKLAIFNSCDGLGIADFLTELNVPIVIVMRQPVPDQIACKFLLYFLNEFSQGKPLCLAVREARDRLESVQSKFPGASWLPTVCQNPNQPQLTWAVPIDLPPPRSPQAHLPFWRRVPLALLIGAVVLTGAIAIATPIAITNRCQFFSSICANSVKDFISDGQQPLAGSKIHLNEPYLSLKQQGIEALSQGRYDDAVKILDTLRSQARQSRSDSNPDVSRDALAALQDPEILIYRNNAFVNEQHRQNPNLPIYTIAVAAPFNLDAGISIVLGVAQAQDVAVKQGVNLQVVVANDNNTPAQAQRIAQALSNDARILAVIGHYTSPNTCAALKVYSRSELVLIAPTSTVVNLKSDPDCGGDPNNVFFRTVSTSRVEASALVQYLINDLKQLQPNVIVFYNSQELFSKDLFEQFNQVLKAYGGRVIATFDLSNPNFDTQQLSSQVKDADALAVFPDGGTGNTAAFQNAIEVIKLNNGNLPVLGANTLYLQDTLIQAKDALIDRLFVAVDWHPNQCGAAAFTQQVREYWGGDLNRRTALAYEAVQAVLPALNAPQVSRQDILQKLSATGIIRDDAPLSAIIAGQRISFDERGDRKEITTRAIVSVNDQLQFDLVKDVPCPNPQ